MIESRESEIEGAWQEFLGLVNRYGFQSHYDYESYAILNELESKLSTHSNQLINQVYEKNKSSFQEMNVENRDWKRKEFIEIYKTLLKNEVNTNVSQGKIGLTSSNDKKLLKEKE